MPQANAKLRVIFAIPVNARSYKTPVRALQRVIPPIKIRMIPWKANHLLHCDEIRSNVLWICPIDAMFAVIATKLKVF